MRQLLVAAVVAVCGCAAQGLPIENGGQPGGGAGAGGVADMARPLGGMGAACQSACDCQAGLACRQGMCGMSRIGPVYCCGSGQCPSGAICQSTNGMFAQCGGGGNGGFGGPGGGGGGGGGFPGFDLGVPTVDGGFGGFCSQIPCGNNAGLCAQLGCGKCSAAGTCSQ